MRVRSPSVPRAFWPICMSSSRWPCLLPRQSLLPQPSVWWAAFPHCGGGTGAKARSRPLRGQSGTVPAECLICRKRWPLFHARLGWDVRARRPAASCGIRRSTFAASTRVLCGEYNPALRMPFVRFRQRAGRNHGRSFMARGNVRKPFLLCRARFTAVAKNIFPDVPFIWLFLGLSRFIPYFCSS